MASAIKPTFQEFLCDLHSLGVQATNTPSLGFEEYAIVEATSIKRWLLVPLANRRSVSSALQMLTPMSYRSRGMKMVALAFNHFNLHPFWAKKRIYLRRDENNDNCQLNVARAVYFSGTPGADRKISIQAQDLHGMLIGYTKLSCSKQSAKLIRHEFKSLKMIGEMELKSATSPTVLHFGRINGRVSITCTDETPIGAVRKRVLSKQHFAFMEELADRTSFPLQAEDLHDLQCRAPMLDVASLRHLAESSLSELAMLCAKTRVLGGLAHGDFTPWNCAVSSDKVYAFDWEMSGRQPLGYDHLHFLMSTNRVASLQSVRILLAELGKRWHGGSLDAARFTMINYLVRRLFRRELDTKEAELLRSLLSN